jgi:hypothetical protein
VGSEEAWGARTLVDKNKIKYMNKNIRCNILIVG